MVWRKEGVGIFLVRGGGRTNVRTTPYTPVYDVGTEPARINLLYLQTTHGAATAYGSPTGRPEGPARS